ncbi:hypothetical protein L345_08775, partial [Ophiophagus hannah]
MWGPGQGERAQLNTNPVGNACGTVGRSFAVFRVVPRARSDPPGLELDSPKQDKTKCSHSKPLIPLASRHQNHGSSPYEFLPFEFHPSIQPSPAIPGLSASRWMHLGSAFSVAMLPWLVDLIAKEQVVAQEKRDKGKRRIGEWKHQKHQGELLGGMDPSLTQHTGSSQCLITTEPVAQQDVCEVSFVPVLRLFFPHLLSESLQLLSGSGFPVHFASVIKMRGGEGGREEERQRKKKRKRKEGRKEREKERGRRKERKGGGRKERKEGRKKEEGRKE